MRNKKGQFIKGNKPTFSEEHKIKISKAKKGVVFSDEHRKKLRLAKQGKKLTKEHRKKISDSSKKYRHHNWKGGISDENFLVRHSLEYRLWREAVFKRDNYTCIWCNQRGGELNADHIQLFSEYPELRFAIDNGRTLCKSCHIKRHKK